MKKQLKNQVHGSFDTKILAKFTKQKANIAPIADPVNDIDPIHRNAFPPRSRNTEVMESLM